jgi:hypothetical protein
MVINTHHLTTTTEIVTTYLDIDPKYKQECIKEAYTLGDSMNLSTNVKAIMSKYDVFNQTKVYNPLFHHIIEKANQILPPYDKKFKYQLVEAWTAIYKKNHYANSHQHLPRITSFVYYLKTTQNSSPLNFPHCNFSISPEEDLLVIFPSYLHHSVPIQTEEEDRICIAGNLNWVDK